MIHDPLLYDIENEQPMQVKSMKLSDRFGQVTHIFSDKTGTITENVMNVKGIYCDGYEYLKENYEEIEIKEEKEKEKESDYCYNSKSEYNDESDISKPIFSSDCKIVDNNNKSLPKSFSHSSLSASLSASLSHSPSPLLSSSLLSLQELSPPLSLSPPLPPISLISNTNNNDSKRARSDIIGRRTTFNNYSRYISLTNNNNSIDNRFSQIFDYHQSTISNYLTNYNGNEIFDLFLLNMSVNHSVFFFNIFFFKYFFYI